MLSTMSTISENIRKKWTRKCKKINIFREQWDFLTLKITFLSHQFEDVTSCKLQSKKHIFLNIFVDVGNLYVYSAFHRYFIDSYNYSFCNIIETMGTMVFPKLWVVTGKPVFV